jgi:hypothetical protein
MATHDYVIDNQTAPNFRADLNNALLAIVSNNSSATQPAVTYANMMWYDTAANILYMRNEDNDAWIALGTLNQTANTFAAAVALASQAEAEAGTDNTKVMTPLRVKQSIDALGGGSLTFIASADASNNATIDFTAFNDAEYDSYLFTFTNVILNVEESTALAARFSFDGGLTYNSTSNYRFSVMGVNSGISSVIISSSSSATQILLGFAGSASLSTVAARGGFNGTLNFMAPSASVFPRINCEAVYVDTLSRVNATTAGGAFMIAGSVSGIRFFANGANIVSGTITMYGRKNA